MEQPIEKIGNTVFVRGISFGIDKEALEEAFSAVGPVRNCFLVRTKGEERHKGYGYVQYALREDAAQAVKQLHLSELGGRKLKVEPAATRAPLAERKRKAEEQGPGGAPKAARTEVVANDGSKASAAAPSSSPAAVAPSKPKAAAAQQPWRAQPEHFAEKQRLVLTVAVGGVPESAQGAVTKLAKAAGKVVHMDAAPSDTLVSTAKLREDGCPDGIMLFTYDSMKGVKSAVAMLHGRDFAPGGKQHKKKGAAADSSAHSRLWARQVAGEGAHAKKWRIIIRNLSFQVAEDALRKQLQKGGFVWELTLARDAAGKPRGFAFASFTCRADVEKAIVLVNQQVIDGRAVAVDWAIAKSRYQSAGAGPQTEKEAAMDASHPVPPVIPADSDAEPAGDVGASSASDTDFEEMPVAEEKSMQRSLIDSMFAGSSRHNAAAESLPADSDGEGSSDDDAGEPVAAAAVKPADVKAVQQTAQPVKSAQPAVNSSGTSTVFLRGLPVTVTEAQLRSTLSRFGPLKACRLVIDKQTSQPKGTAFAEFRRADSAAQAASQSGEGKGLLVSGQKVLLDLALSKDDVRSLALQKAAGHHGGPGGDKRNLYLAKEGQIDESSPAWADVPPEDRKRRKRAAADKQTKLRSPNFCVSRTRLSIRNIPASFTEAALKKVAVKAVKDHASKAQPRVKQAKILREGPQSAEKGLPKSRGRGFIEFAEHEHALCALRQLNNNPGPFGPHHRPIMEFAIDDIQKLAKRRTRLQKVKQSTASTPHK